MLRYNMEKLSAINHKIAALRPLFEAKLQQAAPLIDYLKTKVYEYDKRNKTDKILILGSTGNNLYFPETNENGTYTIEIDILFERNSSNLCLPIELCFSSVPKVALEEAQAFKFGAPLDDDLYIWLRAVRVDDPDRLGDTFLDFDDAEKMHYLKNLVYRDAIPSRTEEIRDHTILGEKELLILRPETESGQPFRTFKTDLKSVNLEEENGTVEEFKFQCLFDKVAGVRIPWPRAAQEWVTRERRWPPESLIAEAVQYGCHAIPKAVNKRNALMGEGQDEDQADSDEKDCEEKEVTTPSGASSVGAGLETPSLPKDDPERMRSWKLSYAWAEQMIANAFSPTQRMAYLMLKQMKREHLDNAKIYDDLIMHSGLTTYHLKTAMFWVCEDMTPDEWDVNPGRGMLAVFERLLQGFKEGFLPNYFTRSVNGLDRVWRNSFYLYRDQEQVKQMLFEPIINMLKDMIRTLDEKLVPSLVDSKDDSHVESTKGILLIDSGFGTAMSLHADMVQGNERLTELWESVMGLGAEETDQGKKNTKL